LPFRPRQLVEELCVLRVQSSISLEPVLVQQFPQPIVSPGYHRIDMFGSSGHQAKG